MDTGISILFPNYDESDYKKLSEITCHDLALDLLCRNLSDKEYEQKMILGVISRISANARTAGFRAEVFDDLLGHPELRNEILKLLEEVQFLKDFGSFKHAYESTPGIWDLLHRLEEINDYILCVEKIRACLDQADIKSEGLNNLKKYVDSIYFDSGFDLMKKDIAALKADTSNLKSITLGINLNDRFETESVGIISVNNKWFKKSGIVSNFAKSFSLRNNIKEGTEWNGDMHVQPVEENHGTESAQLKRFGMAIQAGKGGATGLIAAQTMISMPEKDATEEFPQYLSKTCDQILHTTVKHLRERLSVYAEVSIGIVTDLIPEFIYYIRFAEFIESKRKDGYLFSKPEVQDNRQETQGSSTVRMVAKGFYNIRLIFSDTEQKDIVLNDLDFSDEHALYILTGANRGGKTTITQAVGQMYVLAQGGIYIPGEAFSYVPVDCIYTHFPADEDKTLDLGRLGEECTRFRKLYSEATADSLILMNETFSTTSFEEGYYIAKDSVKALLEKGARTIYNTHMHKIALDIGEINSIEQKHKAASLIVKTEDGSRSFKICQAPPEGMSYARDIAEKYGVTYEMLTNNECL